MSYLKILLPLMIVLLNAAAAKAQDIRAVDFQNYTYTVVCGAKDKPSRVTLVAGNFAGKLSGNKNAGETSVDIAEVTYGDIDRDGHDEAVVVYNCTRDDDLYIYSAATVFTQKKNGPIVLTAITGGGVSVGRQRAKINAARYNRAAAFPKSGFQINTSSPSNASAIPTSRAPTRRSSPKPPGIAGTAAASRRSAKELQRQAICSIIDPSRIART